MRSSNVVHITVKCVFVLVTLLSLPITTGGALAGGGMTPTTPVPLQKSGGPTVYANWHLYRNDAYNFTLRYPPDYEIIEPRGHPQPAPVLRVWFQERNIARSPIASFQPPQFAIDVYSNVSRKSLDTWLHDSGVIIVPTRFVREIVQLGGVEGVRLTDRAQLAPNVFYYVARGPFVYRFTPLGTLSYEMLATISFTP